VAASSELDCQRCGACCVNPPSNREEGFIYWVEVGDGDEILERPELRKHVVRDAEGVPHLRILDDGRCHALRGALGRDVSCTIYHHRPTPCRTVQPGDALCLRYRAEHGVS
jgi:Fe-S-cluster containining protein